MSKALEIASERYAKGEITQDEFEEIRSSINASGSKDTIQTAPSKETSSDNFHGLEATKKPDQLKLILYIASAAMALIGLGGVYILSTWELNLSIFGDGNRLGDMYGLTLHDIRTITTLTPIAFLVSLGLALMAFFKKNPSSRK